MPCANQPSISMPTATTQLPATRTATRAQGARMGTTAAAVSKAMTMTVSTIPNKAEGAAPMAARAEPLSSP